MKLYSAKDVVLPQISIESFANYQLNAKVISAEAMSDYFYKIKDVLSAALSAITFEYKDVATADIMANRYETLHKIKRLSFRNVKDIVTSKPENFKGMYIDYSKLLITGSEEIGDNTEKVLSSLKMAIASYINEYSDNKIITIYGMAHFNEGSKIIESYKDHMKKFFPGNNGSTKAYLGDVVRHFNDVSDLYSNILILDKINNLDRLKRIGKLVQDNIELVDTVIEQKTNSNSSGGEAKKELILAIQLVAKEVEFFSYLYSNVILFYSAFNSLTNNLVSAPE